MSHQIERPLRRARLSADALLRDRSQRGHDLAMDGAMLGDDLARAATVPGAVDPSIDGGGVAAAEPRWPPLAAERQGGEPLPGDDVRERVLHRPPLAPDALERRPAETGGREPANGAIELAVLGLDAREDARPGVTDRVGHRRAR
jgi:hypothetical protein